MAELQSERAEELLALTRELCRAVEQTEPYLARREPMPPALLEEQTRLANLYRLEMSRVKADPGLLRGAPRASLEALMREGARLRGLLDRRKQEVAVLKTLSEGLAEALATEAVRQTRAAPAYGRGGQMAASPAPSVAVNRTA